MIDISVVIVSYNCCDVLCLALDSVSRASELVEAEIFVVDNNSSDNTLDVLKRDYSWVKLIENRENIGFARANNIALAQCSGRVILVLNPDTIMPRTFLKSIVDYFTQNPNSGAVGVQMTNSKGDYLKESKRGYTSISNSFFKLTGLWHIAPKSARINGYYIGNVGKDEQCKAPILSGACMAFTRQLMDKVGVFDSSYFMYSEDIDLSWRMHVASDKGNRYLGNINIVHFKGACTPRQIKYVWHFYSGMHTFAQRYEYPYHNKLTNALIGIAINVAFCFATIKCFVARLCDKFRRQCVISNPLRTSNPDDLLPNVVKCHDAILFDVNADIDKCIAYMQHHRREKIYGFYSGKRQYVIR